MTYKELICKIENTKDGNLTLTKREMRSVVIALKLLDSYDEALSDALMQ